MSTSAGTQGHSVLEGFRVKPDSVQLFCFSAVTWNAHRIHYDHPYTTGVEHHPSIVVHGPLLGAWLLELADKWVNGWGEIVSVSYRNARSAYVGEELTVEGETIDAGDAPQARLWVRRISDNAIVCEGKAFAQRRSTAHQAA